jgi:hypothetical protein
MPATPRVIRFSVTMSRKVSQNYSTYECSISETCDVPETLTDEQLATAKHVVAKRLARLVTHELRAQFDIDPSA